MRNLDKVYFNVVYKLGVCRYKYSRIFKAETASQANYYIKGE